ncbi:MAG TPA: DUF6770 family protein [Chitinophagaceae bacterium]
MKKIYLPFFLLIISSFSNAQSKVFSELTDEVSSEMKIISQDNTLVGYLVFTQLEKVTEDSFNYVISLMDENLNDLGKVNFREEGLNLEAVSFEQDIICLTYLKSNIIGREFKNGKDYTNFEGRNSVYTQFLTLEGKIIKINNEEIVLVSPEYKSYRQKFTFKGSLRHRVQLQNIPGHGFACFYAGKSDYKLLNFDLSGNIIWEKDISNGVQFGLLTSKTNIYLIQAIFSPVLMFFIIDFDVKNGIKNYETPLDDSYHNSLKAVSWGLDYVKGTPYISGDICYAENYRGIFTIDIAGPTKEDIKKTLIYWDKKSEQMGGSSRDSVYGMKSKVKTLNSFRDFNNNTCFVYEEKKTQYANLLKINSKGILFYGEMEGVDKNSDFYSIENTDTKDNYIIADGSKNILIYSLKKTKVMRTIAKKDGKTRISVFPAKEGHIMVVESNKKEKYTRLSIESLN